MSGHKPKQNISTSSKGAITTTTASFDDSYPTQRIVQNFLLIWVDGSIDQSEEDYQAMLGQLRGVVNNVKVFTQLDECTQFLNTIDVEKVFVITSGYLGQCLVPNVHNMPQVDAIYIFCSNKSRQEQWTKKWDKIKGVHTAMISICEALKLAIKQCNQDFDVPNCFPPNEDAFNQCLDQLEPSFMYTEIFKEILLEMEYAAQSTKDLAKYCRELHAGNTIELNIINDFERDYQPQKAIWWYTRECFTYQMLNRALRTLEADTIINMGFFIRDLHRQLEELHKKQSSNYQEKCFNVYRGQGLSTTDFEKLKKTKGGLMSFNNFLSTSKNQKTSLGFAHFAMEKTKRVGILFEMNIDPSISSTPFASIQEVSYFETEEELLFSMHTVFRVGEIKQIDKNKPLYQVNLTLSSDDDEQLRTLTNRIREETPGATGWERLGHLLLKLQQFDKAAEVYKVLLEQTFDESEKALYCNQLGHIKNNQGEYETAIWYYEKPLEIYHKTVPLNHPSLATFFNNIAGVYRNMGQYSKALSFYEKALEIRQKLLPPNHPPMATSYSNIGLAYMNTKEYSKALSFYEEALETFKKTLPPNHPSLATTYNNIGGVYYNMEEYSKALSFYKKSLKICQDTLPPKHPDLAAPYNNIACLYYNLKQYSEALSYFEHAHDIWQFSLPPNHPSIKTVQKNIELLKKEIPK